MDEQLGQNNGGAPMQGPSSESKSWGPAIGLVIILLIIIAGSFYFFRGGTKTQEVTPPTTEGEEPSVADIEKDIMNLQNQSETTETGSIQTDLDATDVSEMDSDLNLAEQEAGGLGY